MNNQAIPGMVKMNQICLLSTLKKREVQAVLTATIAKHLRARCKLNFSWEVSQQLHEAQVQDDCQKVE